jgi:hypothetical protein
LLFPSGVLWLGNELIAGAQEAIAGLRALVMKRRRGMAREC